MGVRGPRPVGVRSTVGMWDRTRKRPGVLVNVSAEEVGKQLGEGLLGSLVPRPGKPMHILEHLVPVSMGDH